MTLGEFLRDQNGRRDPWNCSTLAADWCVALGYPDFAAAWRGVTDPVDCAAVVAGELLSLWDEGIGDGLPVVDEPDAGDIAVVSAFGQEAGAVYTGGKWALRGERCMHYLAPGQVRVVQIWRP